MTCLSFEDAGNASIARVTPVRTRGERRGSWGSRALALVPVGVAFVLGALVLPRAVPPEEVPAPSIDGRALASARDADRVLAERARREPLPAAVRALGSAIREFNTRQARDEGEERI